MANSLKLYTKILKYEKNLTSLILFAKFNYVYSNKKNIRILDLSNNINVNIIDDYAFSNNKIETLKLPNSLNFIGKSAFCNNEIKELDLSNCINLKTISEKLFLIMK